MYYKKTILALCFLAFLLLSQMVSPAWSFMLGIFFGYISDKVRSSKT